VDSPFVGYVFPFLALALKPSLDFLAFPTLGLILLKFMMQYETMVYIMTINLIVRTRLNGVGVDGSGLRKIRAILLSMKPTTSLVVFLSPYPA
jgi:hypothetical protein